MDADWYVDPLDRFDGRFFDGERWTERVSQDGKVAIDPDFPPVDADRPDDSVGFGDEVGDESGGHTAVVAPETVTDRVSARRTVRPDLPAADITESPVRVVATLEQPLGPRPAGSDSWRRRLVWGGLVALAGVLAVLLGIYLGGRNDTASVQAEPVELDGQDAARLEDLETGGADQVVEDATEFEIDAPEATVPEGATFDADELIRVGALRILNGVSVLRDLEEWHRGYADERRIVLGSDAKCWFGQLGGAAVQMAHCGPVGVSDDEDFLYDLVPLVFEDVEGGQIAQPVVDAATPNAVLSNALTLIGD